MNDNETDYYEILAASRVVRAAGYAIVKRDVLAKLREERDDMAIVRWQVLLTIPGVAPFGIRQQYVEIADANPVSALTQAIAASSFTVSEIIGVELTPVL